MKVSTTFFVVASALLAVVDAGSHRCQTTAGYQYCAAEGCQRPWEAGQKCCNQMRGYHWQKLMGCQTGPCGSCEAKNVHPASKPSCSTDGGYQYCEADGCVRPWSNDVSANCCNELVGYGWQQNLGCQAGTYCGGSCLPMDYGSPVMVGGSLNNTLPNISDSDFTPMEPPPGTSSAAFRGIVGGLAVMAATLFF